MRRSMFLLLVAVGLWLLQAEAVTRDDFLMQTTQDLVDVCSVKPGEPLYEGADGVLFWLRGGGFSVLSGATPRQHHRRTRLSACLSRPRHGRTLFNGSWPGLETIRAI